MTQTPSSGNGAMPETGSPEIGTPGVGEISTAKLPQSIDEALKEVERLRADLKKVHAESAGHRQKLKTFEDAEAAARAAQMSELEKAQKQAADLQEQQETLAAEVVELRVHQEVARISAKMNFILPPDMLAKLLLNDFDDIEFADGKPTNIEKLLEKLAKSTPDLVKAAQAEQRGAPTIPAMNPGRSSIQSPGAMPKRIPRLGDPDLWKR